MIKIRKEKIINVNDWDNLVRETYKKPYSFQQQEGCQGRGFVGLEIPSEDSDEDMNDKIPEKINGEEMGVKFEKWLERNPKEWNGDKKDKTFLDLFWTRNFYPDLQTIANDLYKKGLIKKGSYSINIDW